MSYFTYEAADSLGRKVRETAEAEDERALRAELKEKGLVPISIEETEQPRQFGTRKINRKDVLSFLEETASLIESGLPIDKAMKALSVHSAKESMRSMARDIYFGLQRGQTLSQAMSRHKVFPKLHINMIRAAEQGGILDKALRRLASFMEMTIAFRDELVSALIYPLLVLGVSLASVAFLAVFVVPRFAAIFQEMGQALPLPALILFRTGKFLSFWWWAILGAGVLGLFLIRAYTETEEGEAFVDAAILKTPFVGSVVRKIIVARFARTLGTLLESGVPILEAIRASRDVLDNREIYEKLDAIEEGVRKGKGVAGPLQASGVFPPLSAQMISVGEESGRLSEAFVTVAERLEAESKLSIQRAARVIGPLLIVFMAVIVALIIVSMLLAVFSINEIPL